MKKNTVNLLLLLTITGIYPSGIHFPHVPDSLGRLKTCSYGSGGYYVKPGHNPEEAEKKIAEAAKTSAEDRMKSIICIRGIIDKSNKNEFLGLWENYTASISHILSLNFQAIEFTHKNMSRNDKTAFEEFKKNKTELNKELNFLTIQAIFDPKIKQEQLKHKLASAFYGIQHVHLIFYSTISEEFRKDISQLF